MESKSLIVGALLSNSKKIQLFPNEKLTIDDLNNIQESLDEEILKFNFNEMELALKKSIFDEPNRSLEEIAKRARLVARLRKQISGLNYLRCQELHDEIESSQKEAEPKSSQDARYHDVDANSNEYLVQEGTLLTDEESIIDSLRKTFLHVKILSHCNDLDNYFKFKIMTVNAKIWINAIFNMISNSFDDLTIQRYIEIFTLDESGLTRLSSERNATVHGSEMKESRTLLRHHATASASNGVQGSTAATYGVDWANALRIWSSDNGSEFFSQEPVLDTNSENAAVISSGDSGTELFSQEPVLDTNSKTAAVISSGDSGTELSSPFLDTNSKTEWSSLGSLSKNKSGKNKNFPKCANFGKFSKPSRQEKTTEEEKMNFICAERYMT